jgi:hypothetical protein
MPTKKQFQTVPTVECPVPVRPSTSHAADDIPVLNLQLLHADTRDLYQRYLECRSQRKRTEILLEMRETINRRLEILCRSHDRMSRLQGLPSLPLPGPEIELERYTSL